MGNSSFTTVQYLWYFKPNEHNSFPYDVVENNGCFIDNYTIYDPISIAPYINNAEFSDLSEIYELIPHWVIKCDLARLLVVYFNGGLYADVDCFIKKRFDNNNVVLFTERIIASTDLLGDRECKDPENVVRVANYCFGSKTQKHPFFKEAIEECINRLRELIVVEKIKKFSTKDILYVCGPDVLTTVYHRTRDKYKDVVLYDESYLDHRYYSSWWG
jgi:mannosyltransferase OCH1-like enzyme